MRCAGAMSVSAQPGVYAFAACNRIHSYIADFQF